MKKVYQARLPRGAYEKSPWEAIEHYRRKAMLKRIIEVYPTRQIIFTMPEEVFTILTNAMEQANSIESNTTYEYMVAQLPEELKEKIKVMKYNNTYRGDTTFHEQADLVLEYF